MKSPSIGLPDVEWGEAVTAFVVVKPGLSVCEHDVEEHCRARLASFQEAARRALRSDSAALALRQGAVWAIDRLGRRVGVGRRFGRDGTRATPKFVLLRR